MWRGILSTILLQSVQRSIYATLSSFATTMDLETTPRRYNFSNYLAGQAKEWAKFNAQHAFKTWNGYKGAFLTDLPKVLFMSHHHAQAIHNTIHHHQT
ncbi:unnamed protein product [Microthlaspi erraticum]|uniref:Uncharacterized protein n=1 Tax=Microthlaspi erraticum TaxID=1685480 RepID=A0A6D2HHI6_9BRAS|nr:unnamed protein product [Microthlaspi erraticum]